MLSEIKRRYLLWFLSGSLCFAVRINVGVNFGEGWELVSWFFEMGIQLIILLAWIYLTNKTINMMISFVESYKEKHD